MGSASTTTARGLLLAAALACAGFLSGCVAQSAEEVDTIDPAPAADQERVGSALSPFGEKVPEIEIVKGAPGGAPPDPAVAVRSDGPAGPQPDPWIPPDPDGKSSGSQPAPGGVAKQPH